MPESNKPSTEPMNRMIKESQRVVLDILGLRNFINDNKENIHKRLEESELRVMKAFQEKKTAPEDEHLLFLSEILPFMSGIVRVGSSLHMYDDGIRWVRDKLPHTDPDSVLAALALFYIVDDACKLFSHSNDLVNIAGIGEEKKKIIWSQILTHVEKHVAPDSK